MFKVLAVRWFLQLFTWLLYFRSDDLERKFYGTNVGMFIIIIVLKKHSRSAWSKRNRDIHVMCQAISILRISMKDTFHYFLLKLIIGDGFTTRSPNFSATPRVWHDLRFWNVSSISLKIIQLVCVIHLPKMNSLRRKTNSHFLSTYSNDNLLQYVPILFLREWLKHCLLNKRAYSMELILRSWKMLTKSQPMGK